MKIAVASGKGGSGKTLVATNLFRVLSKTKESVALVDCDVEEPNALAFISHHLYDKSEIKEYRPLIDFDRCVFCGKCEEYCNYNAIFYQSESHYLKVIEDLCHGCKACKWACKYDAIKPSSKTVGTVSIYIHEEKMCLAEGRIEIGNHSATSTIKSVTTALDALKYQYMIYDSPPGTACPFMQTVHRADYVILVAEPTPFGLSNLKQSIETLKIMKKPFGIIVNRSGLGNDEVFDYIKNNRYYLLTEIPYNQKIAELYSKGMLIVDYLPEMRNLFEALVHRLSKLKNFA